VINDYLKIKSFCSKKKIPSQKQKGNAQNGRRYSIYIYTYIYSTEDSYPAYIIHTGPVCKIRTEYIMKVNQK
jgi:hypothetical protein